ncbi:MAG: DUF4835 family protein [Bacteroidota bacterium]|nr:DUF4835 family protein [Bacteroidota bacterium]
MRIIVVSFAIIFLVINFAIAQEINCDVKLNTENLTTEGLENISGFEQRLEDYINNHRWTKDEFGGAKINCSFDIFFRGSPSENKYTAQVFIGSQRQIYKSDKSTGTVRIFDDKWEFTFIRNQPIHHNNPQYDPVTSFIDFYVYIILGFDYDSFKPTDGTDFFQKAVDIASKARSGGGASSGWDLKSSGTYNRIQFIEEIINPKNKIIREAYYVYHYKGLDLLTRNKSKALENVTKAVESIGNFQKKNNERIFLVKAFFDTKYLELCELYLDSKDPEIYNKLGTYDPAHQKNYEEYKLRIK